MTHTEHILSKKRLTKPPLMLIVNLDLQWGIFDVMETTCLVEVSSTNGIRFGEEKGDCLFSRQ